MYIHAYTMDKLDFRNFTRSLNKIFFYVNAVAMIQLTSTKFLKLCQFCQVIPLDCTTGTFVVICNNVKYFFFSFMMSKINLQ